MSIRIALVVAEFNREITQALQEGAFNRLQALGVSESNINTYWVPGAVEIPLIAKLLAKSKKYEAIICLGAVIRGETGHYDYVCDQVSQGCQQVMMQYEMPVIFGVLTTENFAQAKDRVGGHHGHKGVYCADAALQMLNLVKELTSQ